MEGGRYLRSLRLTYTQYYSDSDGKASVCNAGDPGTIPELGRSPAEGNGSPLQYSCLENPMDGRASERLHFQASFILPLALCVVCILNLDCKESVSYDTL